MPGRDRSEFWARLARRIRRRYNITYSGQQVERKWRNLVRNFNVSKIIIKSLKNKNKKKINSINIFRIFASGGTERGVGGGRETGKDITEYSEQGSGTGRVII